MKSVVKRNDNASPVPHPYLSAVIIIAFLAFFLCSTALILIDSFQANTKSYYVNFITSDLVIHAPESGFISLMHTDENADTEAFSGEKIVPLKDYHAIEKLIKDKDFPFADRIDSFTSYSIYPALILDENDNTIPVFLKVVDPLSFSAVFPGINIPMNKKTDGIIMISQSLKNRVEAVFKKSLFIGDQVFLGNRYKDLESIRMATLSGIVTNSKYNLPLSPVVYAFDSFGLSRAEKADEEKAAGNGLSREKIEQDFYGDFLLKDQPLVYTELQDLYYFGLYRKGSGAGVETDPAKSQRDFISMRIYKKADAAGLKDAMNLYFRDNRLECRVSTWKEIARENISRFFFYRVFAFWIAGLLLAAALILSIISLKNLSRGYEKAKSDAQKIYRFFTDFKKQMVLLFGGITGAFIGSLVLGIPGVFVINQMKLNIAYNGNSVNAVFGGGDFLFITLSFQAVFSTLIVFVIFIAIAGICPASIMFTKNRLKKENGKEGVS